MRKIDQPVGRQCRHDWFDGYVCREISAWPGRGSNGRETEMIFMFDGLGREVMIDRYFSISSY